LAYLPLPLDLVAHLRFLQTYRGVHRYSGDRDIAKDEKEEIPLLGKAVEDAMNEQIKNELFSAYQYLSMAAYCESENLPGFAQWMRAQSREEVFERALEHEKKVTAMIHDLYGLAVRENDYASQTFLQWFVTEQVEEEKHAGDVVETLKMVGDKSEALFLLDRELGQRRSEEQSAG
jgi:ferritin